MFLKFLKTLKASCLIFLFLFFFSQQYKLSPFAFISSFPQISLEKSLSL